MNQTKREVERRKQDPPLLYRSLKDRSTHVGLLADFFWRNIVGVSLPVNSMLLCYMCVTLVLLEATHPTLGAAAG